MPDDIQFALDATKGAIAFTFPLIICIAAICLLISVVLWIFRTKAERFPGTTSSVEFSVVARPALVFGMYGGALGIFCGMSGTSIATTVVGAVTTTATTYLAFVYGKESPNAASLPIIVALIAFFVSTLFAVQFIGHYR